MENLNWSQESYIKAWDFASEYHAGQTYGGAKEGQRIEYINHLGSVAMEVIWALSFSGELKGNLALQCALLHDTIEDTKCKLEEVRAEFGEEVAGGVMALTKNESLPTKLEQMQDSLMRLKMQPIEVQMVKLADRITNLSPPPSHWDTAKCNRYREEAKLILEVLGTSNLSLATRLSQKIENYEQYTK